MAKEEHSNSGRRRRPPPAKESQQVEGFIDRYLALADALLRSNVQREHPQEKSEPYLDHEQQG